MLPLCLLDYLSILCRRHKMVAEAGGDPME